MVTSSASLLLTLLRMTLTSHKVGALQGLQQSALGLSTLDRGLHLQGLQAGREVARAIVVDDEGGLHPAAPHTAAGLPMLLHLNFTQLWRRAVQQEDRRRVELVAGKESRGWRV